MNKVKLTYKTYEGISNVGDLSNAKLLYDVACDGTPDLDPEMAFAMGWQACLELNRQPLNEPLDRLNLSVLSYRALWEAGIITVAQVRAALPILPYIYNVGKQKRAEIVSKLNAYDAGKEDRHQKEIKELFALHAIADGEKE